MSVLDESGPDISKITNHVAYGDENNGTGRFGLLQGAPGSGSVGKGMSGSDPHCVPSH